MPRLRSDAPSCFLLSLSVRDYELDRFGVVNNAVYQNYLEHTRHAFLESRGVSLTDLHEQGFSPVVSRAEIEYRAPLKSGDAFDVTLTVEALTRIRFVFFQEIIRDVDRQIVTRARITGTVIDALGKPKLPEVFDQLRNSTLLSETS
ncbi:MAG: acyl-CoA thioesterase [SAR324 cluster bacterium]|jgi:acyl-CoA thioester hydrolase|nr:thioesterase [Deltaproteobacteria bacterium]MEC7417807.1 acyl-CoA thioesterase [SAR324 cluster bacterium]HIF68896.1 acyl-CoA thioesterase [Candidatus Lambdaproteobacteria bacterium]HIL16806.1 acyl-CoA thioesterase [Deltaproteobacteria bacterium]HIL87939.1 acyl-CoA thioesterase [Deltaproteobacteria bacterium]